MNEAARKLLVPACRDSSRRLSGHIGADTLAARAIMILAGASLVLFLATALLPAGATDASPPTGKPSQAGQRAAAIVNGHHVQPRRSDFSSSSAEEVQQLYRDLMELTAPDHPSDPGLPPLTASAGRPGDKEPHDAP